MGLGNIKKVERKGKPWFWTSTSLGPCPNMENSMAVNPQGKSGIVTNADIYQHWTPFAIFYCQAKPKPLDFIGLDQRRECRLGSTKLQHTIFQTCALGTSFKFLYAAKAHDGALSSVDHETPRRYHYLIRWMINYLARMKNDQYTEFKTTSGL